MWVIIDAFYVCKYLPGPSSTDKGLPDLKTGSPTVKPPLICQIRSIRDMNLKHFKIKCAYQSPRKLE